MAGVSFRMLSLVLFARQTRVRTSAEKVELSETTWHTYDSTPKNSLAADREQARWGREHVDRAGRVRVGRHYSCIQ